MMAATSLLAFLSKLFSNSLPVIIGNMLSVIISCYFINNMAGSDGWGWYFTPLNPIQLLITVSLLNLIPQFFAMKFANKYKITFDKRAFASKKQT
ncbi:hypothetical protein [Planomicrobium sp. Y74]|uniref:hypothetical protein n=1 Tax=Planomicrobium sp. Y74 TaxID=2478977 RepID=UPI00256FB12A|nr:hypothetical protein [Planomicrobium sp. Y74]